MLEPAPEGAEIVEENGRFFVIVTENGRQERHGPLTKEAAEAFSSREDARLRAGRPAPPPPS